MRPEFGSAHVDHAAEAVAVLVARALFVQRGVAGARGGGGAGNERRHADLGRLASLAAGAGRVGLEIFPLAEGPGIGRFGIRVVAGRGGTAGVGEQARFERSDGAGAVLVVNDVIQEIYHALVLTGETRAGQRGIEMSKIECAETGVRRFLAAGA